MKPIYNFGPVFMLFTFALTGFSQTTQQRTTRQRATEAVVDNSPTLTERARIKNEETSKAPERVVWLREMYRIIDLEKDNNAALYFPVQAVGDRMNLFTTIFKLLADGKIKAYNYLLDKDEVFTDTEKLDFEETLKKFGIPYQKQGNGDNARFVVEDDYIPSYEVLQYQIKEGWYFDAATGSYKSRIIAICPLLVKTDYNVGGIERNAMFWIPYESLRPYLLRSTIMTSDYNNAMTYTIDDFFTKGMYTGEIIKTVNMKDQSLAQQVGSDDPELLKMAQDSIESRLKAFKTQLWVQPDTTKAADSASSKNVKNEKPQAVKQEKSSTSSTPVRSARRTR